MRYYDVDKKDRSTEKFKISTFILAALILVSSITPQTINFIESKQEITKIKQRVLKELGYNLEIAYKWKTSIEEKFIWLETFSFKMYDTDLINKIDDDELLNKLKKVYKGFKNIDKNLDNFRSGISFKNEETIIRTISNLESLMKMTNGLLKKIEEEGYKSHRIVDISKIHSGEEVLKLFKQTFDGEKASAPIPLVQGASWPYSLEENKSQNTVETEVKK